MRPPNRRDGPPDWFNYATTELACDCDMGATRVDHEPPYARYECNSPDCGESYCRMKDDGN